MRFVCESCRAQYMINDEKVGPKGVKVRCRKCGYVILVKRAADTMSASSQAASASDPDDALATQVMQTPLSSHGQTVAADGMDNDTERTQAISAEALQRLVPATAAGGSDLPQGKDSFFGADDADEIGAVFDQVLRSSNPRLAPVESLGEEEGLGDAENRDSTRVLDAAMVRKLAEESGGGRSAGAPKESDHHEEPVPAEPAPAPVEEIPQSDWYVAIDEKQTGPLTLEQLKGHWEQGEIGPDSLCWRAGFDDWLPLSELKTLAAVLAPTPAKPIVMPPAAITQNIPAVVSVPVQSAMSAGGMVQSIQGEIQVPMAAAGAAAREPSGTGWQPSAALSLASLVKDELEAISGSPSSAPPVFEELPSAGPSRGILDVPQPSAPVAAPSVSSSQLPKPAPTASLPPVSLAESPPPPTNPYLAGPSRTTVHTNSHRAVSASNVLMGVAIGGGLLLLVLLGLIVFLVTRSPQVAAPTPIVQVPVTQQPTAPPVVVPPPPPTPTPEVTAPPVPVNAAGNQVAATPTPSGAQQQAAIAPPPSQPTATPPEVSPAIPKAQQKAAKPFAAVVAKPEPEPRVEAKPEPQRAPASAEDDFDKAFGGETKKAAKEEPAPKAEKKPVGYIPPPPGAASADVKAELGESDIMEVVLANKGALAKCVEEQRKKEPGVAGKLVMRWTIQTSGKTSNVNVVSEEFKGAHISSCIGQLIKGWQFPRHKKQGEPVTFPFKF